MNLYKLIVRLIVSLTSICALAACGGGSPATLATIPLPPYVTQLEAGGNPLADSIAGSFHQLKGPQGSTVEVQVYTLPADTAWDQVKGFYEDEIKDDWKTEAQFAQESESFKTVGWTR